MSATSYATNAWSLCLRVQAPFHIQIKSKSAGTSFSAIRKTVCCLQSTGVCDLKRPYYPISIVNKKSPVYPRLLLFLLIFNGAVKASWPPTPFTIHLVDFYYDTEVRFTASYRSGLNSLLVDIIELVRLAEAQAEAAEQAGRGSGPPYINLTRPNQNYSPWLGCRGKRTVNPNFSIRWGYWGLLLTEDFLWELGHWLEAEKENSFKEFDFYLTNLTTPEIITECRLRLRYEAGFLPELGSKEMEVAGMDVSWTWLGKVGLRIDAETVRASSVAQVVVLWQFSIIWWTCVVQGSSGIVS